MDGGGGGERCGGLACQVRVWLESSTSRSQECSSLEASKCKAEETQRLEAERGDMFTGRGRRGK